VTVCSRAGVVVYRRVHDTAVMTIEAARFCESRFLRVVVLVGTPLLRPLNASQRTGDEMQKSKQVFARPLTAAVLTTASVIFVSAAQAQTPSTAPPSSEQSQLSEQKIDAAAAALEQVVNVKRDYQKKLEAAAPSERERIADEADTAVEKAVTNQGLSVDEYTSILVVAQNDPKVREKILRRVRPAE
jgi:hypothetical protein